MAQAAQVSVAATERTERPPVPRDHQPVRSVASEQANPYTYEHVDFDDHSWVCTEDHISETWGPFGLRETPQGMLATTLPELGASRAISLIIDKPLCEGCDGLIVGDVCHACEVVFHRGPHEPILDLPVATRADGSATVLA